MVGILVPRAWRPHGQYERMRLVLERLPVLRIDETRAGYAEPDRKDVQTLVSFNPDRPSDAVLIAAAPPQIRVVAHHQRQWRSMLPEAASATKTALRRANTVVVPAEFLAAEVRAYTDGSIAIVRNGVDGEAFRPLSDRERRERRRELGIDQDGPIAGFVGPLTTPKGRQILERLAEMLPRPWRLIASSVSPTLEKWGRRFPRVVVHRQHRHDAKLAHPIPLLDVVLSLSLCEVAPLIVTESLMSGVPVVATKSTPFFDELARDGFRDSVRVVSLPARVERLGWRSLRLTADEATSVAKTVAEALARTGVATMVPRRRIAAEARQRGMTADAMCARYSRLYVSGRGRT